MTTMSYPTDCGIYPGEYIPKPELESLLEESRVQTDRPAGSPQVNIDEFEDRFVIEAIMPGTRREDIMVETKDNTLSIVVASRGREQLSGLRGTHEFKSRNLERHIFLPKDADTEFLCAEFRQGILRIFIPKRERGSGSGSTRVVVY
jgi:HSP20 family protein